MRRTRSFLASVPRPLPARLSAPLLSVLLGACGGDPANGGLGGDPGGGGAAAGTGGESTSAGGGESAAEGSATSSSSGGGVGGGSGGSGSFYRIEKPEGSERTWLVTPEGTRIFGLGVNTVMRGKSCDGIEKWIRRDTPTETANVEWARLSTGKSNGQTVDKPCCFDSVGAFSDTNDFDDTGGDSYMIRPASEGGAGAPYSVVLPVTPEGEAGALRSESGAVLESGITQSRVGDPFHPDFLATLDARFAERVAKRKNDPKLVMWYCGNEIGIFDKGGKSIQGVRDFRRFLWSKCPEGSSMDAPKCAPHALAAFLRDRYAGDLAKLNAAWESSYASGFQGIVDAGPRPVPYVKDCNQTCREDLQVFVHDRLLKEWVRAVTTRIRANDPNHLVSSPRLALGNKEQFRFWSPASSSAPDVWVEDGKYPVGTDTAKVKYSPFDVMGRDGDAGFDVISVNVYTGSTEFSKPWFTDGIHKMVGESGLPVYVSEFSVRARIDGWTNKGGAGAFVPSNDGKDDQVQRGERYRSQIEQLVGFRSIIGASWHAWSDRYLSTDPAHQINMGLLQCDDPKRGFKAGERWQELDDRVADTNCNIMKIIESKTGL